MLWGTLTLHVLAALTALAAPRLLGDLVQAVEDGTTTAYVDRIILLLAGVPAGDDRVHPLRPLLQPGARRAGAGRAPRGLRRQHARPPGRRRRVGRLRRPAHPHQPRRRPARLVGPLCDARVDDRRRLRRAHLRGRAQRRLVGRPALPAGCPAVGDRAALVPRPRQGRLPARERDVLRRSTPRSPRPSRVPAPSRRWGSATSGSARSTRTSRSRSTPSGTPCSCAPCSSRTWRSPT